VKVWVFKGEILEHDPMASERRAVEGDNQGSQQNRRRENA
jgi:small subunit ribosomal protein S3